VPHTLLLADDSVTIQRVIELTFADEDITVVAVSDGEQAIARLAATPPDIVLADVGMPGKNGYEVAQYVKQTPHLAHIPVVLLTGAFEPVDQARASAAGCDGVLAKPFEPQLVIARVKELLARAAGRAAQAPAAPGLDVSLTPTAPSGGRTAASTEPHANGAPAPVAPPPTPADLENYFDRLDAAFASLSNSPAAAPGTPDIASSEPSEISPVPEATVPEEIDWFGEPEVLDTPGSLTDQIAAAGPVAIEPEPPLADLPLSYASPAVAFEVDETAQLHAAPWQSARLEAPEAARQALEAPEAPQAPEAPETPAFSLPDKPVALPSLGDAFAALLAAEQGEPSIAPVTWPVNAPSMDTLSDQIGRRVLDQISPRIEATVRAAVSDLVSDLAERLIREEIDRIKSAIK
jgi:CheY-like chemotaxis protein